MSTSQESRERVPAGLPEELFQEAVALLVRLTATSSPSDDPPALHRMAAILAVELRVRGLEVTIRLEPDEQGRPLPVVDAFRPATAPVRPPRSSTTAASELLPILLIGHFDTVLPASTPRLEGGRLVATGAIDMKGGIVAFLGALDLVARRGGGLPALHLVLVPDEEVGGAISRRAVSTAGATARALWVLEPGELTAAGETLVTGRRGMFHWQLGAQGRTAHSGLAYWQGRSAVVAAAEWIQLATALSRPNGGPTVNVARFVGGESGFVEALRNSVPPEAGGGSGGSALLGTAHQLNVVPDRALVEGEARFLRSAEEALLARDLAALAGTVAARHQVELVFTRDAAIAPVDSAGLPRAQADLAVRLAAEAGWELLREEDRGGISFPNFLEQPGRIPVLDGLGPAGGGMHTREEHVELASLSRRIRLLADLLQTEGELTAAG